MRQSETAPSEAPLSERVRAPASVARPRHPDVAQWRSITRDDTEIVLELAQSIDRADHPEFLALDEDIDQELNRSFVDLEHDSLIGFDADGTALAYAVVAEPPGQETLVRVFLDGGVRPSHRGRGIGRELLDWQHDRALRRLASSQKTLPGWLVNYADERAEATVRLFSRAGFGIRRYFLSAERMLAEPIADLPAPGGVRFVSFESHYAARTHTARDDAFRDHWGSQSMTDEQWEKVVSGDSFRPELCVLALGSERGQERVVGMVITNVYEQDWQTQGFTSAYFGIVAVVREWRGRKLAPAMLSAALRACLDAGLERVTLDVDADNPSGALGLYQRMGFHETRREFALIKEY